MACHECRRQLKSCPIRLELVDELLQARADPDAESDGKTALLLAANHGALPLLRRLLSQGAAVDQGPVAPLYAAAAQGHSDVVAELLEFHRSSKAVAELRRCTVGLGGASQVCASNRPPEDSPASLHTVSCMRNQRPEARGCNGSSTDSLVSS